MYVVRWLWVRRKVTDCSPAPPWINWSVFTKAVKTNKFSSLLCLVTRFQRDLQVALSQAVRNNPADDLLFFPNIYLMLSHQCMLGWKSNQQCGGVMRSKVTWRYCRLFSYNREALVLPGNRKTARPEGIPGSPLTGMRSPKTFRKIFLEKRH